MQKIFLKLAIPYSSYRVSKLAAKIFLQFGINAEHSLRGMLQLLVT